MDDDSDSDFEPSRLGTKSHWDEAYRRELNNFEHDSDDEGEVWFGIEAVDKMVEWTLATAPSPNMSPFILDIGCGNGIMSVKLAQEGYDTTRILGIDYAADSVRLAKRVAAHRAFPSLSFAEVDFLSTDPPCLPHMASSIAGWDILMDKGTYDAIALSPRSDDGTLPIDNYLPRVTRLLKPGGLFLITTCNFTEEEIKARFEHPTSGLTYHSRIQHRTFTFGGKTGNVCSSVAFRKQ